MISSRSAASALLKACAVRDKSWLRGVVAPIRHCDDVNSAGIKQLMFVLPIVVSVSFFMIADIDSPRAGLVRAATFNLHAAAAGMR